MQQIDFKIVLLGKENCGKTSLVERYVRGQFLQGATNATIGGAFAAKQVAIDGEVYTLGIWDTAGSERYQAITSNYYRNSNLVVLCYDSADLDSFTRTKHWAAELRKIEPECPVVLCGCKSDLLLTEQDFLWSHRGLASSARLNTHTFELESLDSTRDASKRRPPMITKRMIEQQAEAIQAITTTAVSSKTGENIHELFDFATRYLVERRPVKPNGLGERLILGGTTKSGCCWF